MAERKEHHVVIVVRSAEKYLDVMTGLAFAARTMFDSVEAHGYDPNKIQRKLHEVTEERNLAVAECHKLRCELETVRVERPSRTKRR